MLNFGGCIDSNFKQPSLGGWKKIRGQVQTCENPNQNAVSQSSSCPKKNTSLYRKSSSNRVENLSYRIHPYPSSTLAIS